MAKYKVIASPLLDKALRQHAEFIAKVSISTAKSFRHEFADILKRLSENPFQFPACEDPNLPPDAYRKALFGKWYKAIFSVEGNVVYLEVVVDGRMDSGLD